MKGKFGFLVCLMVCLTLLFTLPITASALTARPPQSEEGGFAPDPFSEGDALRYGGLFGPLPDPYEFDPLAGIRSYRNPISSRDIGFGIDEPHYIAITKLQTSS